MTTTPTSQTQTDQIESLLTQLTLAEKVSLLAGLDNWHSVPVPRLDIPLLKVTDGPNGARGGDGNLGPTSACFPVGVALAATWNPALIQRVGAALAVEAQSKGSQVLLAPTVNIHRSPLAGRNFECYSEDPFLTGKMATAYIQGLQSGGVSACIKHFVANDSEFERFSMSSQVQERPLREIYLRPFQMAVRDARPWSLMSAYNRINGEYASASHRLLTEILKEEWGFDGAVVSDWYGTYAEDVAAAGLDIEMPGPARWMGETVLAAVESGELDEALIDDKVRRILRLLHRVGAFDRGAMTPATLSEQPVDRPEDRALIREVGGQAAVLLKNEPVLGDGPILPLDRKRVRSIAVIGENARWAQVQGGGSAGVSPHYVIDPFQGIKTQAGDGVRVNYAIGTPIHRMLPTLNPDWLTGPDGSPGFRVTFYDNRDFAGEPVHTATTRRSLLNWYGDTDDHINPADFALTMESTLTVPESGTFQMGILGVGTSRLLIDGQVVLESVYGGSGGDFMSMGDGVTETVIDLVAGHPYALRLEFASTADSRWRAIRLGCMIPLPGDPIAEAVALATRSDVAVIFAGLSNEWESEGVDRETMDLPGAQTELIRRVVAANPNTVVVLNTGSPVTMPWADEVPAVVQSWYAGQEAGNAIADVLFGTVDPAGRLPTTFPRRLADNPAYLNYPGENGKVLYGEGLFVGYRYYDAKGVPVLFPFGHGLSYAEFAYANLAIAQSNGAIRVSVDVANTGSRSGQEVVQLYVTDVESRLVRPEKELRAFAKIALAPGETETVSFELTEDDLVYYDPALPGWVAEPGAFRVLVGRSAADIRVSGEFEWQGKNIEK
ncbi:MAG: glycoside hydrolase family 3 C-terminal domain-containing protein [Caldilineaceae bacterium]|nr:glycoside hydrolase family 3 C-terminal domain-containing protein [Caldilineaceae bacterium]